MNWRTVSWSDFFRFMRWETCLCTEDLDKNTVVFVCESGRRGAMWCDSDDPAKPLTSSKLPFFQVYE